MHNESVNQVQTLITLLTGILKPITGDATAPSAAVLAPDHYERIFIYCLAWSLGGLLDTKDRVLFDAHLRTLTSQAPKQVRGEQVSSCKLGCKRLLLEVWVGCICAHSHASRERVPEHA